VSVCEYVCKCERVRVDMCVHAMPMHTLISVLAGILLFLCLYT